MDSHQLRKHDYPTNVNNLLVAEDECSVQLIRKLSLNVTVSLIHLPPSQPMFVFALIKPSNFIVGLPKDIRTNFPYAFPVSICYDVFKGQFIFGLLRI